MKQNETTIDKSDILQLITDHHGNKILARALEGWTEMDLLCGLAQYIHFNSVFAGGVASLSGEIARRQDLFQDPDEQIKMLADQSVEVASKIFFSAIDEFGRRKTHRTMAKDTLRAALHYYAYTSPIIEIDKATTAAANKVTQGYSMNQSVGEAALFHSIGFHIGSELLADQEFNIIDQFLQNRHQNLVHYLKEQGAYTWIQVHTTVEADHFEASLESANAALIYYTGCSATAKMWILEGFSRFARLQSDFMGSLLDVRGKSSDEIAWQSSLTSNRVDRAA